MVLRMPILCCTTQSCLALLWADLINVKSVQTSAFFRVSSQDHPYADTHVCVRKVIDAFGPERVMWGSDFPWVTEKCGYSKAWRILPDGFLSPEEREWVSGRTLASLFPDKFGSV